MVKHPGRLAAATVILGFLLVAGTRPVSALNTVASPNAETTEITLKVEVYGPTALQRVRDWKRAFDRYWGDNKVFTDSCRKVVFKLDIRVAPAGGAPNDYHKVTIVPKNPVRAPHISRVANRLAARPTEDNWVGEWEQEVDDASIAHEFGHLLGLDDEYIDGVTDGERDTWPDPDKAPEYIWRDANKDGIKDKREVSLKRGETRSLMAETDGGKVLRRHIKEIIKKHVPKDQQRCEVWKGTIRSESTLEISFIVQSQPYKQVCTEVWDLLLNLTVRPGGAVQGKATANLVGLRDCRSTASRSFPVNRTFMSFDVTGRAEEKQFRLQLWVTDDGGLANQGGIQFTLYAKVVDDTLLVPIIAPGAAKGTTTITYRVDSQQSQYTSIATGVHSIQLQCETCEAEPVG